MHRTALLLAMAIPGVVAQSKTGFDVASIKPNAEKDSRFMMRPPQNGRFMATGVTLKMLIMSAYDVQAFQISDGPSWVGTERWDIEAKAEDAPAGFMPRERFNELLRNLLEDRFQLKVRRESKEMPIYELELAKNGPKLKPHSSDRGQSRESMRVGYGMISDQKARIATLAFRLSALLGRTVVDKTGLKGEYDFTLEWSLDPGQGGPESVGLPPSSNVPASPADPDRPSIFTAVEEQLGLRLESQKGPVDIITIDTVSKPSEN